MPRKYIFFLLVSVMTIGFSFHVHAMKQDEFDRIKQLPDNELKIDSLLKLSKEYWYQDPKFSIEIARYGQKISVGGNYRIKEADALNIIGVGFYFQEKLDSAVQYFNQSLELCRSLEYSEGIARVTNNLGLIHDYLGNYDRAIAFYYQSLEIEQETNNNEGIATTYLNIGTIYYYLKEYDKALDYMTNSLRLYQLEKYEDGILRCFTNIGTIYAEIGISESALSYSMKALDLSRRMNNPDVEAANLNNIGEIYYSENNFVKSIDYYNQALVIEKEFNDRWSQANTTRNIGLVYLKQKKYTDAERFFNEALSIADGIMAKALLKDLYLDLFTLNNDQNNHQAALTFHIKHTNIKDSIFGEEKLSEITRIESSNKLKYKDQQLGIVTSENEVKSLTIKTQQYALYITATLILLFLSIILIFYTRIRANKKEKQLLESSNTKISEQKILLEQTITQLKESEEKHKALTSTIQDGLIIIQDRKLIFANDGFCQILGYKDQQEVFALKTGEIIAEHDIARVAQNYNDRIEGKEVPRNYDIKIIHKSGKIVDVSIRVNLIRLKGKLAIIGTIKDISKAKTYEKELILAKEKAEKATHSKSLFLAGMSHEIRNHLNSILGFSDVLGGTKLDKEQQDYLRVIKSSGDTLIKIINDILDLSRIEMGHISLDVKEFDPRQVVLDVGAIHERSARNKSLMIETTVSDKIQKLYMGDSTRLNQVLVNLVANAINFTDKGSVSLSLEPIKKGDEEGWLKFSVKDTGIGIPETNLKKLFLPFAQVHAALERKLDGSGLGLVICKHIINLLGGEIGVESEIGKGSHFWFIIKLEPAAKKIIKPSLVMKSKSTRNRILLVEDNEVNQHLTTSILRKEGYSADIATNGKEGVDLFMKEFYNVILMDIQMPVMDGIEATGLIRDYETKNYQLKSTIIAITAHAKESDKQKLMDAGLDHYLQKPFIPEDLLSIIRRLGN